MTSVIIPAFNEETVIGRTLDSLIESIGDSPAEILVVCNACNDRTAEIARSYGQRVQVIETTKGGKCNAINLGEKNAKTFPRIYLDADITVSPTFFADIENALCGTPIHAAWPNVAYDTEDSSWLVAGFYRVWTTLPYNRPGRIGVGVYAVSETGRATFGSFPNIISDDGYFRGLFDPEKRLVVHSCHTFVLAPRDLRSLVAVRVRSRMGVQQLHRDYPELMKRHSSKQELTWKSYLPCLKPGVLAFFPVYFAVVLLTKISAFRKLRQNEDSAIWNRDLSQRSTS